MNFLLNWVDNSQQDYFERRVEYELGEKKGNETGLSALSGIWFAVSGLGRSALWAGDSVASKLIRVCGRSLSHHLLLRLKPTRKARIVQRRLHSIFFPCISVVQS